MNSNEIRQAYLDFFVGKQHKVLPSSSLIPHGDPTLLLTTAGMVQIKPYFLGIETPPNRRLVSCQKCFRTTDVDSVGDNKHLTFFEMLGNFSVGDYFKKEAIEWAWEFVTQRLRLPQERLWVTIYLDDDEAFNIWRDIGFPTEKIVRLGDKDNFWGPAGDSGPCGPCSEIHYDFGEKYGCGGKNCGPDCSCSRFSEIWNLVFTQYNQERDGKRSLLPKPNIDTGMGLERIVAVSSGKPSIYDTDLFLPLTTKIREIANLAGALDENTDKAVKIIAEHSRGITFLIADGLLPSNEGRGYVLRRILRRACFLGRKLEINKSFLGDMAMVVIDKMGSVYPELAKNKKFILDIIANEEGKFDDTLDAGINLCEKAIMEAKAQGRKQLSSEDVFKFWDTYGFPFELSSEIAKEHGLTVDLQGFELEMEKQRDRARAVHKFSNNLEEELSKAQIALTEFVGYEHLSTRSRVSQIIDSVSAQSVKSSNKGNKITLILDKTPFYGEMGGQLGDTGIIASSTGKATISNALSTSMGSIALSGTVIEGTISEGDIVEASVDEERRMDIARNHTATHILQSVLRRVLGSHVAQRGSLVAPDRLRFDFTHLSAISPEQLSEIQSGVNEIIRKNMPVLSENCPYNQAIQEGATAIFEEKYGDTVRVVQIGTPEVSKELCGGTHVRYSGEIGYFLIISEVSVGTGLRRIEAVTGRGADSYIMDRLNLLNQVAINLKTSPDKMTVKLETFMSSLAAANKTIASLQREISSREADKLIREDLQTIGGINTISAKVSSMPVAALMEMGDILREKIKSGVIVLATIHDNKPYFIASATQDVVAKGIHSGKLVKRVSELAGGSGGGKPDMAQAGAKYPEKIDEALSSVTQAINELLKG